MADATHGNGYPDKGWAPNDYYRCLGFGCGWGGAPFKGTACKLCGTVVPAKSMTQKRWRHEVYDQGKYQPFVAVGA